MTSATLTRMPVFRVTVTASYAPTPSGERHQNLLAWASSGHDRAYEIDHSIPPVRLTATAVYRIDAPTAEDAEERGRHQFNADAVPHGIDQPESVVAAADLA